MSEIVLNTPLLTLKRLGNGQFEPLSPLCGFSRNVFSRERVNLCFFGTFNIIISHTFPKNLIEFSQVIQKILSFKINCFHHFLGIFGISLLQRN